MVNRVLAKLQRKYSILKGSTRSGASAKCAVEQARATQPGVAHGGELPAVFGSGDFCNCLAILPSESDRVLWARVADRWDAFARTGEPSATGGPSWPKDGRLRATVMEFGEVEQAQPAVMRDRLNAFIGVLNLVGRATQQ